MQQRFWEKMRPWMDALAALDDPVGDYLISLEERVRRLEGEVESLRKGLSTDPPVPAQSTDLSMG